MAPPISGASARRGLPRPRYAAAVIEVDCGGRWLRGVIDAIFIPPGCEENCVGTVFLSES